MNLALLFALMASTEGSFECRIAISKKLLPNGELQGISTVVSTNKDLTLPSPMSLTSFGTKALSTFNLSIPTFALLTYTLDTTEGIPRFDAVLESLNDYRVIHWSRGNHPDNETITVQGTLPYDLPDELDYAKEDLAQALAAIWEIPREKITFKRFAFVEYLQDMISREESPLPTGAFEDHSWFHLPTIELFKSQILWLLTNVDEKARKRLSENLLLNSGDVLMKGWAGTLIPEKTSDPDSHDVQPKRAAVIEIRNPRGNVTYQYLFRELDD